MNDASSLGTQPEPLSVGPPAPQELPSHTPSLHDALFGDRSEYKYDDQASLASLEDHAVPRGDPIPTWEILTDKQHDVVSISEDTFYDDRSLEARIHRSLMQRPTSNGINKSVPQRLIPLATIGLSREAKLERTLEQTRKKFAESQHRISHLQRENELLHEECQRLHQRVAKTDASVHNDTMLREEIERLRKIVKELNCTNTDVQAEAKSLAQATKALEGEKERMVETWQNTERDANDAQMECAKLKKDLEFCRNELAETKKSKNMIETQMVDLRKQNKLLEENLSEETKKSASTVTEMQSKLENSMEEYKELQTKMQELSLHLEAKSKACSALMTKKAQLEGCLKRPSLQHQGVQTDALPMTTMENHSEAERPLNMKRPHSLSTTPRPILFDSNGDHGNPLSDRLNRIRESAEKASLVREHQRDISRLQSEHAAQIAILQQDFDEEKARFTEDSHAELNHRTKELKRRLVTEYEKKLDDLERKHKKELQRIRDETDRQSATATESVEAAMSEVAKTTSQLERETRKCHALELQIGNLQSAHATEKELLTRHFEQELKDLQVSWEDDKNALLTSVQSECNTIIEKTRERPIRSAQRSLRSFPTAIPMSSTTFFTAEVSPMTQSDLTQVSPTVSLSELSQSLLETEAMVEKVLRN